MGLLDQLKKRCKTGIKFIDDAFGGKGMTPSVCTLFTGTPGAGKTTLMLQLADSLTRQGHVCLFNTAEESLYQVRLESMDGEVLVTVLQGDGFADGLAAERLLKIIKEYST